jgi:GTP-sensing pleiotropic transcriptional regulator CodY
VQRITGKSERYGRLLLKRIKDHFKKDDHQFVSVDEFCVYTGVKIEQITDFLLV